MRLKCLCLGLLLLAGNANAACESWMATGSTNWIRECNGGVDPYPQPQEYGTRTDIYLTDDGRIERTYQHLSNDEDDEVRVYGGGGYDYEADEFGEDE